MDGMVRRVRGFAAGVLFALAVLPAARAAEPTKMRYFKTQEFEIIYLEERNDYILPHLAGCFANSLRFYRRFFEYTPSEPVTLLLQDFDDYGYAGATPMPLNYVQLGIEPFEYVYETSPTNERINWVMSHELLHVVASDEATGRDLTYRKLFFGKVQAVPEQPESMLYSYLTTPRLYAPRWYHEGMAVFMETWLSGGYGRALGATTRWSSGPWSPTGPTSTTRSASSPRGRPSTSRRARCPTSTAPASSATSPTGTVRTR